MKTLLALLILSATSQAAFTDPTTGHSWVSPVETLGMVESEATSYVRANYDIFYYLAQRIPVWQLIENVGIENIIDIFGETQLPGESEFRQTAGFASPGGHMVGVTNPIGTDIHYETERVTGTDDFYTLKPLPLRGAGDPLRGDNLGFWFVKFQVPEPTSAALICFAAVIAVTRRGKRVH